MSRTRVFLLQGIFNLIFFIAIISAFPIIHYIIMSFNIHIFWWQHADWHLYIRNFLFAVLIFFFRHIWKKFNQFVDIIIYPEEKTFSNELRELRDQILNEVDYVAIFDRFINGMQDILKMNRLVIYYEKDDNPFTINRIVGIDEKYMSELQPDFSDPITLRLSAESCPLVLTPRELKSINSPIARRMSEFGFHYVIPLMGRTELKGAVILGEICREGINQRKLLRNLNDIVNYLEQALEHAQLYQQAKRESVEKGILMEIGRKIATYRDMNEILNWMMDAVKEIVPYDAGGIIILDEGSNTMTFDVLRGYPPEMVARADIKLDEGVVGWSVRNGKGDIIPDVSIDERYCNARKETRSEIVVPLISGQKVIGGLCFESNDLNAFTNDHYELMKTFASQAALIVENAKLYFEVKQKEALEQDMAVARSIQRAFFPRELPYVEGYSLSAKCISLEAIGGDLYDLISFEDERLGIVIGDSSGKGISGAILMAALFATFRERLKSNMEVNELVGKLNNSLTAFSEPGKYSTFFYGVLDSKSGLFQYTNAGHNYPLLLRSHGEIVRLDIGGTVLGFFKDLKYRKGEVSLEEGDLLTFYTDGVTETHDSQDEEFGEERLINFLMRNQNKKPNLIEKELLQTLQVFNNGKPFEDDVTLVFVKRETKGQKAASKNMEIRSEEKKEMIV